ncbi:MAG: hypothetical protein ACRCUT_12245, partial [Spirochaetota bacterium]
SLCVNKGQLLVLAENGGDLCVRHYSPDGELIKERILPFKSGVFVIASMCADSADNLYVLDMTNRLIVKIGAKDEVLWVSPLSWTGPASVMGNPFDLAVSADGKSIFVTDSFHRRIVMLKDFSPQPVPESVQDLSAAAEKASGTDNDWMFACLNTILKKDPMNTAALGKVADFYAHGGSYDQALVLYKKLADAGAGASAEKKIKKAQLALYLRRADGFSRLFEQAVSTPPAQGDILRLYYEEAVRSYGQALSADPGNVAAATQYAALKDLYRKQAGNIPLPPLEVLSASFNDIFAAVYPYYRNYPAGELLLKNGTGKTLDRIAVQTDIPPYTERASESAPLRGILPGTEIRIPLYPVFSDKILSVSDDTSAQALLTIRYWADGKDYSVPLRVSWVIRGRNAVRWDDAARLAAFITPADESVKAFASAALTVSPSVKHKNENIRKAAQLFDALGKGGIRY